MNVWLLALVAVLAFAGGWLTRDLLDVLDKTGPWSHVE